MKKHINIGDVQQTSLSTWKWTIRTYSKYVVSSSLAIYSPNFSVQSNSDITNWRFEVYPNGENAESNKYLSIFLTNLDSVDATASCEFCILNKKGDVVCAQDAFTQEVFSKRNGKSCGISQFISHEFLNNRRNRALTGDILTLQFRLFVGPKLNIAAKNIEDDFKQLIDSLNSSDVTLIIGEKKLHVHKTMLIARSPVFEAMFQYNMRENQENTVRITDLKFNIVKEMCRFIYFGKVNEINIIATDLLCAADKYCIVELKALCEKTMCDQLDMTNIVEYYQVSKMYDVMELKKQVFNFIKADLRNICLKTDFLKLDHVLKTEFLRIFVGATSIEGSS